MRLAPLISAIGAALLSIGIAQAEPNHSDPSAKKINGDPKSDLAPLSSGKTAPAPLDHANFPPPGGATMGAGPNPMETGPIDADRAGKK